MRPVRRRETCRVCGSRKLTTVLDLGAMPLANAFVRKRDISKKDKTYPLQLVLCSNCSLVQLAHVVDPSILFADYQYRTSASRPLVEHFERMAKEIATRYRLTRKDLVVEFGSNDGSLLGYFKKNTRVLGVDPDRMLAAEVTKRGIETIPDFFTAKVAQKIVRTHGHAKIIVANNVFAHIDNLNDVIEGIRTLLTDDGVFVFEAHWVGNLIGKGGYDQIYHEHLSYFSLHAVRYLMHRFGLVVTDVEAVPIHGESLRVHVRKSGKPNVQVQKFLEREKRLGLHTLAAYKKFAAKVAKSRIDLKKLIARLKKDDHTIAAYGAPAKGNTLLNHVGLTTKEIAFITDTTPEKQGTYAPGTHIPVLPPAALANRPDYLLLLAWNYAPQILTKEKALRQKGTKFIIPVPNVRVIQ